MKYVLYVCVRWNFRKYQTRERSSIYIPFVCAEEKKKNKRRKSNEREERNPSRCGSSNQKLFGRSPLIEKKPLNEMRTLKIWSSCRLWTNRPIDLMKRSIWTILPSQDFAWRDFSAPLLFPSMGLSNARGPSGGGGWTHGITAHGEC